MMFQESALQAVDGLMPQRALAPESPEQVAEILKQAAAERLALVPVGGGTMLDLGAPLRRADLLLALARLDRVLDYQPANLTVRAEAGLTLGVLNQQLAEHGQYLPLDPPCPDRATLGGILAANASGARRVRYGSARDLLIGIRVAMTDGQLARGGGQVVKNVAGYDLPKLYIGSLGTLGVIVEATFKLAPLPKRTATVVAGFGKYEDACAVGNQVLTSRLSPLGLTLLDSRAAAAFELGTEPVLAVQFGGVDSAIERQCNDVTDWSRAGRCATVRRVEDDAALWARVRDFSTGHPTLLKISVLPTQIGEIARAVDEIAARRGIVATSTVQALGIMLVGLEGDSQAQVEVIAEVGQAATALRAYCIVQKASRAIRESADVWGPPRSDWALMEKLRREFDPNRILNPGRFIDSETPGKTAGFGSEL